MDKKTKILLLVFALIVCVSIGLSYNRYIIKKDYYLRIQKDCDPSLERCFIYVCDPTEDSECPQNEAERVNYYKYVNKKAYLVPDCDPKNVDCPQVSCDNDSLCNEILCDEQAIRDGESCNDPANYKPVATTDNSQ